MKLTFIYKATVVRVVDGDTIDLNVDLGFHTSLAIRTRLLGINAPEISTIEGRNARDQLRDFLVVGSEVRVETFKDPTDKYGRWLAKINRQGTDIADWMLGRGLAQHYNP